MVETVPELASEVLKLEDLAAQELANLSESLGPRSQALLAAYLDTNARAETAAGHLVRALVVSGATYGDVIRSYPFPEATLEQLADGVPADRLLPARSFLPAEPA